MLHQKYVLQNDREEDDDNADQKIRLRAFLHITMALGEIGKSRYVSYFSTVPNGNKV